MSKIAQALSESGKRVRPPRKPKTEEAPLQASPPAAAPVTNPVANGGQAPAATSRFGAVARKAKTYDDDQEPEREPELVAPLFPEKEVASTAPMAPTAPAPRFKVSAPKTPAKSAPPTQKKAEQAEVKAAPAPMKENAPAVTPPAPVASTPVIPAVEPVDVLLSDFEVALTADDIPVGSAFPLERWIKEQNDCHPDKFIYELRDEAGSRFATMPIYRGNLLEEGRYDNLESRLFTRSLMVKADFHQDLMEQGTQMPAVHCVYNYQEWAHKSCQRLTYMVTRSKTSMRLAPNCPIWNNMPKDLGSSEAEREARATQRSPNTGLEGSGRFGSKPSQPQQQQRPCG